MSVFSASVYSPTVYKTQGIPSTISTTGGIPFEDARRYREYLEKLNGIKQAQEITPEIIEAAQAITEIPLETRQVSNLTKELPSIDFEKLSIELIKIQRYIDQMELATIQAQKLLLQRQNETALLLLI